MSITKTKVAPVAKPERLIYAGPNIPSGMLPQYTVFKGGLPAHLGDLFNRCPAVRALIVPVADFAKAQNDIATIGTPAHSQYGQVLKFIMKGV